MKYLSILFRIIHKQIILPFQESHAPVNEVCLGTSVGLIWSMTPLIGIQMYLGLATWILFRIVRIRFYLPIAIAMIWITNPVTLPFFYYIFYVLGKFTLSILGVPSAELDFGVIYDVMAKSDSMGFLSGLWYWTVFLLDRMGLPMFIGGFVVGIPAAIAGYPLTYKMLNAYRTRLAEREGITLKEWEEKHVRKDIGLFSEKPSLNPK